MSQDISTHHNATEPVADSISLKPWSAEAYAEQLMDDLFSDLDRILEGGGKLPTEPAKPEYVSLQPVKMPQIAMPSAVMSLGQVLAPQGETPNADQPQEKSDAPPPLEANSTPRRRMGLNFDKLLLVAACGSLAVTLILWWASHKRLNFPVWLNVAGNTAAQNTLSQPDAQFVNYMLRSLELIDRKAQASRQQLNPEETAARLANVPSVPSQPSPGRANNLPQVHNSVPAVVGILPGYYPQPQYQPPQVAPPFPRPAIPINPPGLSPIRPSAAIPISPPAANPIRLPALSPVNPLVASPVSPSAATPTPAASPSPQPSQSLQPPVARRAVTPSPTVAETPSSTQATPEPKHTLVGLLSMGDRSAALFDIGGVTQRIQVGEPIGTSGWTLVTVTKDEAIIRRNGEVRSIYAGQKF